MPSYYEAVGEEPTCALAEGIIKALIRQLQNDIDYLNDYPNATGYTEYSLERLGYSHLSKLTLNRRKETLSAIHLIIKHFPDVLIQRGNSIYVKDRNKHLLVANDLLIVDYYLILLNEYEERVNKYQRYLKKQQDRQRNKLLLVLFLPLIMVICMLLVGD